LYLAACHQYGKICTTKANDGVAFTTVTDDKEESAKKRGGKKKDIMYFRCKKTGHYSNECDEELPKSP